VDLILVMVFPSKEKVSEKSFRLGKHKPYHYAVVEAPYPSKAACTSMWSTAYNLFESLHMQWMGI
jgi:hypothetical protein